MNRPMNKARIPETKDRQREALLEELNRTNRPRKIRQIIKALQKLSAGDRD